MHTFYIKVLIYLQWLQLLCHIEAHSKWILYSRSLSFCVLICRNLSSWFKRLCVAACTVLRDWRLLSCTLIYIYFGSYNNIIWCNGKCRSKQLTPKYILTLRWPCVVIILIIKPTRRTISQIYFFNKTLHVSNSSSVHHQEFFTVYAAVVYVIQVCWQLASRIRTFRPDPARKLSANLYDIYHCCVYSEKFLMMDGGTVRNM